MITIENSRKLPASIIFINLASLFSDYCKSEGAMCPLHYKRNNECITISVGSEDVMNISVTETDISIKPIADQGNLFQSSERFIHSLLA